MSRILVTGASGFLGARVVAELQAAGATVRTTGRQEQQKHLPDYWPADLRHSRELPEMLTGVTGIVHCAGLAHQFRQHNQRASQFQSINCEATERLALTAAVRGVERFVFVSSVSVYAPTVERGLRNENAVPNPLTPYAISKRDAEIRLLRIAAETGMRVTILRMATLYGEGDPGNVGRLMNAIRRRRFVMIGPGENKKSLLHVGDAARGCARAVLQTSDRPAGIWNVAAAPCSMKEIVAGLSMALGYPPPKYHLPAGLMLGMLRTGATFGIGPIRRLARCGTETVQKWLAEDAYDGSRFAADFDWQPEVTLEEGFRRMAAVDSPVKITLKRAA